jgi:hypothetical protein
MIPKPSDALRLPHDSRQFLQLIHNIFLGFLDISEVSIKQFRNPVRAGLTRIDHRLDHIRREDFRKLSTRARLHPLVRKGRELSTNLATTAKRQRSEEKSTGKSGKNVGWQDQIETTGK